MPKKIALVTLQDNGNIGNRLQNYALQTILEKYGCVVYNFDDHEDTVLTFYQKCKEVIKFWVGAFGSNYYKERHLITLGYEKRIKASTKFNDLFIHNLIRVTHTEVPSDFDLGIVGSDQVWHHWFAMRNSRGAVIKNEDGSLKLDQSELAYYYLSFLPSEKRTAYAASFGFEEFPKRDLADHINGLQGMHYISCREQSGCDLVKSVTGRDVPHVLDPTLLLEASDWRRLETDANDYSKGIRGKYAFVFFLGAKTEEYKLSIIRECKRNNIKTVVDFNDLSDENIASCGPAEFLYFIDHAQYVFTDSFHCTVFSIIFEKRFMSYHRQQEGFMNMFGRIEELLKMTGHEDSAYGGIDTSKEYDDFETIKKRSVDYLNMILEEKSEGHTVDVKSNTNTILTDRPDNYHNSGV